MKYFFSNQPNINRILLNKIENIKEKDIVDYEKELIKFGIKGSNLKVFLWEQNAGNIQDNEDIKLLILKKEDEDKMKKILETKGKTPRVYRNTIFFLYPLETERTGFVNLVKRKIAYENIEKDQK